MTNLNHSNTQSNTTTATNNTTLPTFKAGDRVLYPAIGNESYTLEAVTEADATRLAIRIDDNLSHIFHSDGRNQPNAPLPLLFHDTPVNRQAIQTLWGVPTLSPSVSKPKLNAKPTISLLEYQDTLSMKSLEMDWLNSLFTAIRTLSKDNLMPQSMVSNLIVIGEYLSDTFQYQADQTAEQIQERREVTE